MTHASKVINHAVYMVFREVQILVVSAVGIKHEHNRVHNFFSQLFHNRCERLLVFNEWIYTGVELVLDTCKE